MKFNLAILSVLAARPEQRIPLEEVSREVKRMIAGGDGAAQVRRSSELGDADVFEAGITINSRQVCAAHGAVLVEQQFRSVDRAVVVEVLRLLEIIDRFVDPVLPLVQQR